MVRVNGQNWKPNKMPFRPGSGQTTYAKRMADTKARALTKAHENELKDEKEAERQRRIQALKDKRAAKAEKERYELMALKMHRKRVERLRRREKRNKLINS